MKADAGESKKKNDESPTKQAQPTQSSLNDSPHFFLEANLAFSGLFSRGSESFAMGSHEAFGYCFDGIIPVTLFHTMKFHPQHNDFISHFHTIGLSFGWRFWKGFFAELGGGVAFSYIQKDRYRDTYTGAGALGRLGYQYAFHKNAAFVAAALMNYRYLGQSYFNCGVSVGLQARF